MKENNIKDKFKNFLKFIKELNKTPRGKALLFFGVYFIFFLALAILARVGGGSSRPINNNLASNYNSVLLQNINSNNYEFIYTIFIDDNNYIYKGSKKDNEETFVLNDVVKFYRKDDIFYKEENGNFIKSDNPYLFSDFVDILSINKLMEDATYVSKTDYESGEISYNFLLATESIVLKTENINIDIDSLPNDFIISTNKDGEVAKLEFNLDNYGKFKNICNNQFRIKLEYFNYGKVKEISGFQY